MAAKEFGTNDALTNKLWAKKLAHEALEETYLKRFIGTSKNSLVYRKDEANRAAGDKITCGLRMQLSGDGKQGHETLEGDEESLTFYNDALVINELRHAVRWKAGITEQRVPFNLRTEAKDGLKDWMARRYDVSFFNHICGYTVQSDTKFTGNNAVVAPTSTHHIWSSVSGAITADENLTATDIFLLEHIDYAVERAKTIDPIIRPVRVNGEDCYVMFLHPYQVTDLRTDASTSRITWFDTHKQMLAGGKIDSNPILNGALGKYNNVILHESEHVTQGVHSSTGAAVTTARRAVMCGAQSALIGFGKGDDVMSSNWYEEKFDYGNQIGVKGGSIHGLKKSVYNSADFATIVVSTRAEAH